MLNFPPGDWHEVTGRGNIYVTGMPCDYDDTILDTEVKIEGHVYTVKGVETFSNGYPQPHKYVKDQTVGLCVRGERKT